jgi:hypothetical protein
VISADGSHIYSTSASQGSGNGPRLLDCWELTSGKKVQFSPAEPSEEVVSIALLPDGKKLAVGIWCLDDPRDFGPGAVDIIEVPDKSLCYRNLQYCLNLRCFALCWSNCGRYHNTSSLMEL